MRKDTKENMLSAEEIVTKYFEMVYRLAFLRTGNSTDTDDIVQEVFLRYIKHADKFKTEEHAKAWLIRVTVNCISSLFSSSWRKKTVALDENLSFEQEERHEVYYAVLELPEKYRAVIHLYYYEGMSTAEIAGVLSRKEATVRSQLKRGREMLKEKLKGGAEDV